MASCFGTTSSCTRRPRSVRNRRLTRPSGRRSSRPLPSILSSSWQMLPLVTSSALASSCWLMPSEDPTLASTSTWAGLSWRQRKDSVEARSTFWKTRARRHHASSPGVRTWRLGSEDIALSVASDCQVSRRSLGQVADASQRSSGDSIDEVLAHDGAYEHVGDGPPRREHMADSDQHRGLAGWRNRPRHVHAASDPANVGELDAHLRRVHALLGRPAQRDADSAHDVASGGHLDRSRTRAFAAHQPHPAVVGQNARPVLDRGRQFKYFPWIG